jgi:hypothetical protein
MSLYKTFSTSLSVLLISFLLSISLEPAYAATLTQVPTEPVVSPAGADLSYNWAGYVATGDTYTSVTGTWTVPTVEPSSSLSADATWVGIGGVKSRDLIQAGTVAQNGSSPTPTYRAWYEMLPNEMQQISMSVKPGDSITTSLKAETNNQWQISIKNNTTGELFTTNVNYLSSLSSAEWIEETPSLSTGAIAPLDNFGSVTFTGGTAVVNGSTETIAKSGAKPMTMLDRNDQVLAAPQVLSSNGTDFTVRRSATTSTGISPSTFVIIPFHYTPDTSSPSTITYTPYTRHSYRWFDFGFDPSQYTTTFTWTW